MRQALSHRLSGMIMSIIMRPCSRIFFLFLSEFAAKLYRLLKMTKQTAFFLDQPQNWEVTLGHTAKPFNIRLVGPILCKYGSENG